MLQSIYHQQCTLNAPRVHSVCRVSIIQCAQTSMKGDVKGNPLIYRRKGKYNHETKKILSQKNVHIDLFSPANYTFFVQMILFLMFFCVQIILICCSTRILPHHPFCPGVKKSLCTICFENVL